MKQGGEGSELFFEVVFQLAVIEQAEGGIKKRRHGEFDLIWLGQGAITGPAATGPHPLESQHSGECGHGRKLFRAEWPFRGRGIF